MRRLIGLDAEFEALYTAFETADARLRPERLIRASLIRVSCSRSAPSGS